MKIPVALVGVCACSSVEAGPLRPDNLGKKNDQFYDKLYSWSSPFINVLILQIMLS